MTTHEHKRLRSVVKGVGSALPRRCVTNRELEKEVETSDEWIVQRTGITQRYLAGEGETTSTLGAAAARAALAKANCAPEDIDLIICATSTPDYTFPSVADHDPGGTRHHRRRGLRPAGGVRRLRLRRGDRRQVSDVGLAQARAGDRGRNLFPDHGLERPHHLRAVRRRRRRDGARGAGRRRHESPIAAS